MPADRETLDALRGQVARLSRGGVARAERSIPISPEIDAALPGAGLARAAVHEIAGPNAGPATAFCALLLARASGSVAWIGSEPDIWPDGLAAFRVSVADLVLIGARKSSDGLWAMEEALRSSGLAGAVLEGPSPNLVAGRRLQLAAEVGGGLGLLLLPDIERSAPSAARTSWRVSALPSEHSGTPRWRLELRRCLGGQPGQWDVEVDLAYGNLRPFGPAAERVVAR